MNQRILLLAGLSVSLINFRGTLLRELVARGNDVIAFAPIDDNSVAVAEALSALGVTFSTVKMERGGLNPLTDFQTYRNLVRVFRMHQPDIIIAYTAKPVIYGGMAARKVGGIRFYPMITGLGYAFTEGESFKRKIIHALAKWLYREGLRGASAVIFQNPDDRTLFRELDLQPRTIPSFRVHGSGVDLETFPPMPLPDAPIFLMLARLVADKGVREYVAAARQVKRYCPNAVFRLGGGLDPNPVGIKTDEVQRWVREGVIEYLGELDRVQSALHDCRFYVLPSYREGTPRSVLEALATGRPVITTDAPGCRETVFHGENGILVPPGDVDALSQAMVQLIEASEGEIRRMADASLELARDRYDVHEVNAEILQVMGL